MNKLQIVTEFIRKFKKNQISSVLEIPIDLMAEKKNNSTVIFFFFL